MAETTGLLVFDAPAQPALLLGGFVLAAAFTDLRARRIPNLLTGCCIGLGLGYHMAVKDELGIFLSVMGLLTGLILVLPVYALGGIGAGDVKLFMGIGAWIGPQCALQVFIVTSLLIGIVAIWMAVQQTIESENVFQFRLFVRRLFPQHHTESLDTLRESSPERLIPVGILIAIAVWTLVLWGWNN